MEDLSFEVTGKLVAESNTVVLVNSVGNSTTIGSRTKVGILGDPHPGLNSSEFFCSETLFRSPEI